MNHSHLYFETLTVNFTDSGLCRILDINIFRPIADPMLSDTRPAHRSTNRSTYSANNSHGLDNSTNIYWILHNSRFFQKSCQTISIGNINQTAKFSIIFDTDDSSFDLMDVSNTVNLSLMVQIMFRIKCIYPI